MPVMIVVTLESMIALIARLKPLRMAIRSAAPLLKLLANPLVNQHVGVDGHADGEHQAGQAGQRERRLDQHHQRQDQQQIERQREAGHDAGEPVVDDHEQHDGERSSMPIAILPLLDGFGAERRADDLPG